MADCVDIERLAAILRQAAIMEIMPRFRNLSESDVRQKTSATDLVTEGDEAAERSIAAECRRLWPEALFIGEESVAADKALLDKLDEADLAIVVDPIDGTANFAAGLPLFGVMAAVVSKGETIAGMIYDPVGDDLMVAELAAGAFQKTKTGETRRLRVAEGLPLDQTIGCVSATYYSPEARASLMSRLTALKIAANYRNAGHEYRLLASGGAHLALYSMMMPWDHLPGTLLVSEAGGHVAMSDGMNYGASVRTGTLLSACDEDVWHAARDALLPQG